MRKVYQFQMEPPFYRTETSQSRRYLCLLAGHSSETCLPISAPDKELSYSLWKIPVQASQPLYNYYKQKCICLQDRVWVPLLSFWVKLLLERIVTVWGHRLEAEESLKSLNSMVSQKFRFLDKDRVVIRTNYNTNPTIEVLRYCIL